VEFRRGRIAVLAVVVLANLGAAEAVAAPSRAPTATESTVVVRMQMKQRGHRAVARELRVRAQDAPAVVRELNAAAGVAWADIAPQPAPLPASPNYTALQRYRHAAGDGLAATYANTLPGGQGENVRVVDIEYNWNFAHEDLSKLRAPGARVTGQSPPVYYGDTNHGTAVMGIMGGNANNFGVTGIAPRAQYFAASPITVDGGFNVARAIYDAMEQLRPGDVLLLEQQTEGPYGCGWTQYGCVPIEWDNGAYDAIVDATAAGIIVVEAGGNGSQNLDRPEYGTRFPKGKPDSGAIIVGAGNPGRCGYDVPVRGRLYFSNWGSRVDVQGWGDCIATAGYGDLSAKPNANYTALFGGTSGASAQIAGVAASLSGIAKERGRILTSRQVRSILRATGSPQPSDGKRIGPLPDLRRAISALASTSKPALNKPTATFQTGSSIAGTIPTVVQWSASDASGITAYKVWRSVAGGAFTPISLSGATARARLFNLTPRQQYAFAVMARNAKGSWSDIKVVVVTPRVVQDRDPRVKYGAGWRTITDAQSLGGTRHRTNARGVQAKITFTGNQLMFVAKRTPTRGVVAIYIDGKLRERVPLAGPELPAWAVRTYRWPTTGPHTFAVVSPADGKPADVDAFITS
jgi:serine protease